MTKRSKNVPNKVSFQMREESSSILALLLSPISTSNNPIAMNVNAVLLSTKSSIRSNRGNPIRNVPQTNASLIRTFSGDSHSAKWGMA